MSSTARTAATATSKNNINKAEEVRMERWLAYRKPLKTVSKSSKLELIGTYKSPNDALDRTYKNGDHDHHFFIYRVNLVYKKYDKKNEKGEVEKVTELATDTSVVPKGAFLLSSFYWNEQKKQVDFEGMKPLALAL
jgi:hypothetical protein